MASEAQYVLIVGQSCPSCDRLVATLKASDKHKDLREVTVLGDDPGAWAAQVQASEAVKDVAAAAEALASAVRAGVGELPILLTRGTPWKVSVGGQVCVELLGAPLCPPAERAALGCSRETAAVRGFLPGTTVTPSASLDNRPAGHHRLRRTLGPNVANLASGKLSNLLLLATSAGDQTAGATEDVPSDCVCESVSISPPELTCCNSTASGAVNPLGPRAIRYRRLSALGILS